MGTRSAWCALLLVGACYGGGEPAGPLLTWTDGIHRGDGDQDDNDQDQEYDDDEGGSGTDDDGSTPDDGVRDPAPPSSAEVTPCLEAQVAALRTKIDACRTCHIPKGLARDSSFLLSKDKTQDAANLLAAFDELGRDLFLMPAQEGGKKHPGGRRLTKGTADYDAWLEMMDALADPESCEE